MLNAAGEAVVVQRLKSRQQFQAVMSGAPVAKTPHFALHRAALDAVPADVSLFPVADAWLGVLLPKRWARRKTELVAGGRWVELLY